LELVVKAAYVTINTVATLDLERMLAGLLWANIIIALGVCVYSIETETGILWNIFDGSVYEGEYKRGYVFGSRDGKGAQRWYRSGNGYEGDFVENMKHGKSSYFFLLMLCLM